MMLYLRDENFTKFVAHEELVLGHNSGDKLGVVCFVVFDELKGLV